MRDTFEFLSQDPVSTLVKFGFAALAPFSFIGPLSVAQEVESSNEIKAPIAWSQLGSKAGVEYHGDGLAVVRASDGARMRCVFQRLEGEVTREGLWLASTVANAMGDRFRVKAVAVGRADNADRSAGFQTGCIADVQTGEFGGAVWHSGL